MIARREVGLRSCANRFASAARLKRSARRGLFAGVIFFRRIDSLPRQSSAALGLESKPGARRGAPRCAGNRQQKLELERLTGSIRALSWDETANSVIPRRMLPPLILLAFRTVLLDCHEEDP